MLHQSELAAPKAASKLSKGQGWLKGSAAGAKRREAGKKCCAAHEGEGQRKEYHSKYTLKSLAGKQSAKVGDAGRRLLQELEGFFWAGKAA